VSQNLADQSCPPCTAATPKLTPAEIATLAAQLPDWGIEPGPRLRRAFAFPDFLSALDFVNQSALLAEELAHHPDILLAWGKAEFTIWTHAIGGLSRADFILAAKISRLNAGA